MKQTTDVSADVRYELGRVDVEKFYCMPVGNKGTGGLGWAKDSSEAVDWPALDATLSSKGHMYKLWLAKQSSGFCGTQSMVAHWDRTRDGKCPNCQRRENAHHLNLCPNKDRTDLLFDMARDLEKWMLDNYSHLELAYWIPRYIMLRGTRQLADFPAHTPEMLCVAVSQDKIPWKDFMEGKLSKEIFSLQAQALACSPSKLSAASWAKKLISHPNTAQLACPMDLSQCLSP